MNRERDDRMARLAWEKHDEVIRSGSGENEQVIRRIIERITELDGLHEEIKGRAKRDLIARIQNIAYLAEIRGLQFALEQIRKEGG